MFMYPLWKHLGQFLKERCWEIKSEEAQAAKTEHTVTMLVTEMPGFVRTTLCLEAWDIQVGNLILYFHSFQDLVCRQLEGDTRANMYLADQTDLRTLLFQIKMLGSFLRPRQVTPCSNFWMRKSWRKPIIYMKNNGQPQTDRQ